MVPTAVASDSINNAQLSTLPIDYSHLNAEDETILVENATDTTDLPLRRAILPIETSDLEQLNLSSEILNRGSVTNWNKQIRIAREDFTVPHISDDCGHQQLFESRAEKEVAINANRNSAGPHDRMFPDLFRWGLLYRPSIHEGNTLRTLSITNLPLNISLSALLNRVRGGLLVTARLLDTSEITGSFSALITFLLEDSAKAFEDFAESHPIYFSGKRAQVQLVKTPTYPLSPNLFAAIHDHKHTRSLKVSPLRRSIVPAELRLVLRVHRAMAIDAIEYMQLGVDGALNLRFSSIEHAGKAQGILSTRNHGRDYAVSFVEDPCALPLESLLTHEEGQENKTSLYPPKLDSLRNEEDSELRRSESVRDAHHTILEPASIELVHNKGTLAESRWATPVKAEPLKKGDVSRAHISSCVKASTSSTPQAEIQCQDADEGDASRYKELKHTRRIEFLADVYGSCLD